MYEVGRHVHLYIYAMDSLKQLHRTQIDRRLAPFRHLSTLDAPQQGWVRTIRQALGMSLRQLAERLDLSKSAVHQLEQREPEGGITLDSLRRLAHAMEADLVYAIVPRRTLEETLECQAQDRARDLVRQVADSMGVEGQGTSSDQVERLIESHRERLLRKPRRLWDE